MILEALNLYKSYAPKGRERVEILRGVSLSVAENELLTIVGASGSGKTTLLNILGTLDTPDSGTVQFRGEPVIDGAQYRLAAKQLAAFRNQRIGFVFQFHHLLEDFTALENAAMPRFILTGDRKAATLAAEELLVGIGLKERLQHLPSELSGGEQQRVAVARALVNSPDLVLADEPSGNLDTKNSDLLYEHLTALARTKRQSFILVTHNERYAALSDRCYRMEDGELGELSRTAANSPA